MRRLLLVVLFGVLLATAGCVAPGEPGDIGEENGYRYDADLAITTTDGLNESEREALLGRTMARVEHIRGLEFTDPVEISVISRATFRNRTGGFDGTLSTRERWNEQVWEALHIVGEDTTYPAQRGTNRGSSVVGYYSPRNDSIVLVSDSPTPQIDRRTLVHELVHALQDQRLNLGERRQRQDGQLAVQGIVEGDANYVQDLYSQRCGAEWDCIDIPPSDRTRPESFNQGLFLVSYLPYAEGPRFVHAMRSRGGWDAVNDRYDRPPASTEQLIHPDYFPTQSPRDIRVPDRARGDWGRFSNLGEPRTDTVGEGSIYAMFVSTGVIDRTGAAQYDYDHPLSTGWAGDTLVPYRDGTGEYGYVWRIRWDSTADAREFVRGYREILDGYGADRIGDGRWVVSEGAFTDAFRVTRDGKTVTIVNAPRRGDLDRIHPAS
jgi:hypothetical protein